MALRLRFWGHIGGLSESHWYERHSTSTTTTLFQRALAQDRNHPGLHRWAIRELS